jgi:hypothetical protein
MTNRTSRVNDPDLRDVSRFLNPSARPAPTYFDVFTAELTTLSAIDTHENRIYQVGYTPGVIRDSIRSTLQTTSAHDHIVNFHERDIPPKNGDLPSIIWHVNETDWTMSSA